MIAEENNNADSYDGRDGVSRTVFVWGKTIMVNIEGEITSPIPPKNNPPFVEWGGEETGGVHRGVTQELHSCMSPIPHSKVNITNETYLFLVITIAADGKLWQRRL